MNNLGHEDFCIDPEAKTAVRLTKISDVGGQPYYIGKLQFPGTIEFEKGVCFMVFVSEEGVEELQISPIDPAKLCKKRDCVTLNENHISVNLYPLKDSYGKKYYIGEAMGITEVNLRSGIFFTIFTSRIGQEEIQISRLKFKKRQDCKGLV